MPQTGGLQLLSAQSRCCSGSARQLRLPQFHPTSPHRHKHGPPGRPPPQPAIQRTAAGHRQPQACRVLQAERHRERPYDQLVIETTGMANPLPIMQVFSIPEIAEHMTLVRLPAALQTGAQARSGGSAGCAPDSSMLCGDSALWPACQSERCSIVPAGAAGLVSTGQALRTQHWPARQELSPAGAARGSLPRPRAGLQDGIVTMVDAKHVHKRLDDKVPPGQQWINEALEQIAYADRIILNKTDLVRLAWVGRWWLLSPACVRPEADRLRRLLQLDQDQPGASAAGLVCVGEVEQYCET